MHIPKCLALLAGVIGCSSIASAQANAIEELAKRKLDADELTIRYKVHWRNRLSKRDQERVIKERIEQERKQLVEAGRDPQEFRSQEVQLIRTMSVMRRSFEVTFSYSNSRFFYECKCVDCPNDDPRSWRKVIYGNERFGYRLLERAMQLTSTPDFRSVTLYPLIGLAVKGTQLIRPSKLDLSARTDGMLPSDVKVVNSFGSMTSAFGPGYVKSRKVGQSLVLDRMIIGEPESPFLTCEFGKYEPFLGTTIARHCLVREYFWEGGKDYKSRKVQFETEFEVSEIEPKYVGVDAVDLFGMVRTGDPLILKLDGKPYHSGLLDKNNSEHKAYFSERTTITDRILMAVVAGVGTFGLALGIKLSFARRHK